MSFTIGGVTGVAVCLTALGLVSMAGQDGSNIPGDSNIQSDSPDGEVALSGAVAVGTVSSAETPTQSVSPTTIAALAVAPPAGVQDASPEPSPILAPSSPGLVAIYGLSIGSNEARPLSPIASGVVIDGLILTSAAALADVDVFELTLDGQTFRAELIGVDRYSDLAVLMPTNPLFTDSDWLTSVNTLPPETSSTAGDAVAILAAGGPPQPELAMGEVVATNERLTTADGHHLIGAVLTTVRRIEGGDGGALVDADGNTIAIVVSSDTYHAAAIPVHEAIDIGRSILEGDPAETWLGIGGEDSTDGIVITSVSADGPAFAGGLLDGDIVTAVQGIEVRDMGALVSALRTIADTDRIDLDVIRDGNQFPITVRPNG